MYTINFSADWGGKVYMDEFTTIRMVTRKWKVGDRVKICLNKKLFPNDYMITNVEIKKLKDFSDEEIINDLGALFVAKHNSPRDALMGIMKSFYSKKWYWKEGETEAQKISLRKLPENRPSMLF